MADGWPSCVWGAVCTTLLLLWLPVAHSELQIAILMQGSDFINISVVPFFDVNQFDLGDVFISPCRSGTYNEARNSFCKDCSVCTSYQYERETCIAVRNRVCLNCTICSDREQELCQCSQRTAECITGDRVCIPLPPTSANITFDLRVSAPLSALKQRFMVEGLHTGFVLFLSDYLQHTPDDIMLITFLKVEPKMYLVTYIVDNVYSLFTKKQVQLISKDIVQIGLTSTFGVQSNTFGTVTEQRRRRLLQQPAPNVIQLSVSDVTAQCVSKGDCQRFFAMTNPQAPCDSECVSLPCPPGFTGFYGLCELCPNATYKALDGNESCTQCPLGAFSNQGSVVLEECWFAPTTTTQGPTTTTTTAAPVPTTTPPTLGSSFGTTAASVPIVQPTAGTTRSPVRVTTATQTSSTSRPSTRPSNSSSSSAPVQGNNSTPTPPPPPSSGGGEGNNYYYFNVTYLREYLLPPDWNSGRAGTVQYITINETRDEWVLSMVFFLMVAGMLSIAAIGSRLFIVIGRRQARGRGGGRSASSEPPLRRIPLPILLPCRRNSSDHDEEEEEREALLVHRPQHHIAPETVVPPRQGPYLQQALAFVTAWFADSSQA